MKGVQAVVIGASAGVSALFTVLGGLPSGFAIPVVCVLHLLMTATANWPRCCNAACFVRV